MSNTRTSTKLKNEIVDLLLLDFEESLKKIQDEHIEYTLTKTQTESIVKYILNHDKFETIENNLFNLNHISESLPEFIKIIYENYNNVLKAQNKNIAPPPNYAISSIEYIKVQQTEAAKKIAKSERLLSELLDKSDKIQEDFETKTNEVQENFEKKTQKVRTDFEEKISKTKDSIILLTVTVLGIFSSLTFSLSGSLSILNNVFDTGNSLAETLFKFSLIGIFVADLIFLLIYAIAKINNKSIAMHCSRCKTTSYICQNCDVRNGIEENNFKFKKECFGCEHKNTSCQECQEKGKTIFCKMRHKFYYIYFINVVCVIVMVISLVMGITGHGNFSFNDNNSSVVSGTEDSSNEGCANKEDDTSTQSNNSSEVVEQTETTTQSIVPEEK